MKIFLEEREGGRGARKGTFVLLPTGRGKSMCYFILSCSKLRIPTVLQLLRKSSDPYLLVNFLFYYYYFWGGGELSIMKNTKIKTYLTKVDIK